MQDPPLTVRIDYDDAPTDIIDKINVVLAPHGLQLVDDDTAHAGFVLYALVDSATAVDSELETLEATLDHHARGFSAAVRDNWDKVPEDARAPEALTLEAFRAGAGMACTVIESRAGLAGMIAERSRREKHR